MRRAIEEREIDYPVAADNDYAVWRAFDNHYWPALYFVDADGAIRDHHFGEGRYEQSERVIQRLLGVDRELVSPTVEGVGVEAEADWEHLRSPETYLGYAARRPLRLAGRPALDEPRAYELPTHLPPTTGRSPVTGRSAPSTSSWSRPAAASPTASTRATRTSCLAPSADEPIPFRVLLDGEAPGPSHGVDVDEDGGGVLRDGRMYQLVRQRDGVRERTLEITFLEPGARAYSLTFG